MFPSAPTIIGVSIRSAAHARQAAQIESPLIPIKFSYLRRNPRACQSPGAAKIIRCKQVTWAESVPFRQSQIAHDSALGWASPPTLLPRNVGLLLSAPGETMDDSRQTKLVTKYFILGHLSSSSGPLPPPRPVQACCL